MQTDYVQLAVFLGLTALVALATWAGRSSQAACC